MFQASDSAADTHAVQKSPIRRGARVVLRSKPRILRGLTWNLLGYVALIAMTFDVKEIILATYWAGRVDWSWLLTGTLSGLFVLICASLFSAALFSLGLAGSLFVVPFSEGHRFRLRRPHRLPGADGRAEHEQGGEA